VSVRVGICGAGRVSRLHADGFVAAGATVARHRRPGGVGGRGSGAGVFASLNTMIAAGGIDVICIATPHDLHIPQARAAVEAGLDVIMDKPLALDPEEGRALVDLAGKKGRRLGVNHNLLFHPAAVGARKLFREGALGRPAVGNRVVGGLARPRAERLPAVARADGGGGLDRRGAAPRLHAPGPARALHAARSVSRNGSEPPGRRGQRRGGDGVRGGRRGVASHLLRLSRTRVRIVPGPRGGARGSRSTAPKGRCG
jgi:myo-inositol 2-dehydrogenase/D-chiro-inositol 1-dehydrogenase